ncbi:MAG: starvation-sensing protein RspA [Anaerotruncus sp.]|nr:starvation-sensing protein RspA [Anaerotruncus sp.]
MSNVTIKEIKTFILKPVPTNPNLIVVKVETSEPGLYGLGCATFAYRSKAVKSIVQDYFRPLLIGRRVAEIEDIWHLLQYSAYWRSGPVQQNAISGIDIALWDIKGKMAGMPVYDLLGGKCREGAVVYRYANGRDIPEMLDEFHKRLEEGNTHIRVRTGSFGGPYLPPGHFQGKEGLSYSPQRYIAELIEAMQAVRREFGNDVELLHDTHERLDPPDALRLAREMEQFRLFFLEDLLAPEQGAWYRQIRAKSITPLAMGELFVNPKEWDFLFSERLIDYIRVHITAIGGITPAKKLAVLGEAFGIKTAFHGPTDVTPIGHAANLHLDYSCHNFGIQEWAGISPIEQEIFPGCPELRGNTVYLNGKPGLGIDFDERLAAKYPPDDVSWIHRWQMRLPDGTIHTP